MITRTWVRHREHGGYFHCPDDALPDMQAKGWEISEAPPEPVNPAVAEQLAWQQAQAERHRPRRGTSPEVSES